MISIQDARGIVVGAAAPLGRVERVPVVEATGRVLACEIRADGDLPPFDRVMMDGYAVRVADLPEAGLRLPMAGEVAAGDEADAAVAPGTCHEIMTGSPLPPGADAVVPVEWTDRDGNEVRFDRVPAKVGQHVASRGEDLAHGQSVAEPGDVVTALSLSLLISSGAGEVDVAARPRVAVLTSGNELVPPGSPVRRGQIRESNGPALTSLLASTGADAVNLGVARDTREDMERRFDEALGEADVVVLTGGSSVGKYDLSADVVESRGGHGHFDRIAVKPGKPTLFYTVGDKLVFCLPGNPVAALMTGRVLVAPALRRLMGAAVAPWTDRALPLEGEVKRNPARDLLIPMRRRFDGDHIGLVFDGWHGSGDLVCMSRAEGFAYLERGEGKAGPGTAAGWFALDEDTAW